jgi:hypothetical protein
MNNKLKLYNDILFGKLRPFRNRNIPQIKFRELTKDIKAEYYSHQPNFEVDFFPPHTDKAKYYRKLIFNEGIRYFNHITDKVENAIGDDVKTLWIKSTLNGIIADKLSQINAEIERLNYSISNIDPKGNHRLKETNLSEETYIYQYLKVQLIQLFLDIQENFKDFVDEDILNEDEIYLRYFNEAAPNPSFIKEAPKISPPSEFPAPEKEILFEPVLGDIRPITSSKATYETIIYKPRLFADIEKKLYEYDIIDIDSRFIPNRKTSNHRLLAAVIYELIQNGYFRRQILGTHKKFTDIDIRKYIEERYLTDVSQQFTRLSKEQIEFAKRKLPWLEHITEIS